MCCCCNLCKTIKIIFILNLILLVGIFILFLVVVINNGTTNNSDVLVAVAGSGDNSQVGDAIINFGENQIVEGNAISHVAGTSQININENGIYQISYQLEGIAQGTSTRFNFNAILLVNNVPLADTLNEGAVLSEDIVNNRYTLTSTVILRLNAGDVLQLGALSFENITYPNARIDIEKIG